ncbi:DoxX family protein, partial [Bacteroidales bacterium OttesenSCG-928-L03]|nr:DoxX family protein [Bacteroidales bacterium OttesenSCG-928-L03]
LLMLTHGMPKLMMLLTGDSSSFADPIGLGSTLSLFLIACAEVGCSLLLIFGIFTRLAVLPLLFSMIVAFAVVHSGDPFGARELPFIYICIYITLLIAGPGRFSIDSLFIRERLRSWWEERKAKQAIGAK